MGLHSCSTGGGVDSSKFSEPMPWIGLYIAATSLLCALLMGLDAFYGFCRRKPWFPCRFFSLNATSLTLLSVATKLPVDLNTSMPGRQDQLTKLSGTVLICTVMGNFMTSLGTMDDSEMISNVVALSILVITVIINVGIQMGTGVIYVFLTEHAIIMLFIVVLLVILCSTALAAPTAKKLLEKQYDQIHIEQSSDEDEGCDVKKLRENVKKYWMMAHTCSPQYVVGRSATCTASGAFCLLSALILLQAAVRSLLTGSLHFCQGKSDYTWSMTLVLISQTIAIGVGTIAPAFRWFNAISFRSPKSRKESCKGEFKVENYWVQRLVEWNESPLPFHINNRRFRKIVHVFKSKILNLFIKLQSAVVLVSKLIRLASILPLSWLSRLSCCCKRKGRKDKRPESESGSNLNLSSYVLHLDGEEDLVELIMTNGREDTEHWIRRGRKNTPNDLVLLLMKSKVLQGFKGLEEFDSDQVHSIGTETPLPNCWALPVVTLTSIAITISLPYMEKDITKLLQRGVDEGLKYVRLIEKHLDTKGLFNMREAADIVWLGIDIYDRWLDKDLRILAHEEKNAEKIIEKLADIGEKLVSDYTTGSGKDKDPRDWPTNILAANSMYRICRTILLKRPETADRLFESLQQTIADVLVACFTNLPRVISMECFCCPIELREESVREAAYLLGEAEKFLEQKNVYLDPRRIADIDNWNRSALPSTSFNDDISSCISV